MENNDECARWIFHRRLGAGAFGVVELWRNDFTQAMIAIKKCKGGSNQLTERQRERWIQEVDMMNLLNHPNIVSTRCIPDQLKELDNTVLCMEYCSRGDLRTVLNESENCCGIEENEAIKIMLHISSAVEYLHSRNLIHRDLKPENIVWQGYKEATVYKLTDLGYVRELGEMSANASVVGTLNYIAPELLMQPKYTNSVDYWSLGILFYEIVTGSRPFLPNMPITLKWMEHIMKKKDEHISAREDGGRVNFSSEIESPTTVSDCMRRPLTAWFRIVLQWDAKKRGKYKRPDGEYELVVFSTLKSILSRKILRVFVVPHYKIYSFAVLPNTTVQDLHNMIYEQTGIDVVHQILTDRTGNVLNVVDHPILNCTQESFVILFQRNKIHVENPAVNMYSSIQRLMENGRKELDPDTTRRYYAAAVYFIKQEVDLFKLYVIALSIKIDLSHMGLNSVSEIVESLTTMTNNLMSEMGAYLQSPQYNGVSDKLKVALDTTFKKTRNLLDCTQEVSSKLKILSKQFDELKNEFFEYDSLKNWTSLYDKAKDILEKSGREFRRQRVKPIAMVKLIYDALKLRGEQHQTQKILSIVNNITSLDGQVLPLQESLKSFQGLVDLYRKNYEEILSKVAIEAADTSLNALIDSMTPNDTVIYDNIVLRRLIDELYDGMQNQGVEEMDFGELEC